MEGAAQVRRTHPTGPQYAAQPGQARHPIGVVREWLRQSIGEEVIALIYGSLKRKRGGPCDCTRLLASASGCHFAGTPASIIPTHPNHPGVARFVIQTCQRAILQLPTEDIAGLELCLAMRSIAGDAGQHAEIAVVDRFPIIALILKRPAASTILATE